MLSLLSSVTTLRSNRLIFFFGAGASVGSEEAAGVAGSPVDFLLRGAPSSDFRALAFTLASSRSSLLGFVAELGANVTGGSSNFVLSSSEPDSSL